MLLHANKLELAVWDNFSGYQSLVHPFGRPLVDMVWNRRASAESGFLSQYDAMLKSSIAEYSKVNHVNSASDEVIRAFLGPGMKMVEFPNHQDFDIKDLKGRLLSASYSPVVGEPGHKELMAELLKLFNSYQVNGSVRFDYQTQVYSA